VKIFGSDKSFVLGDTDRRVSEGDKPSVTEVEDANIVILTINATFFCYLAINNTDCFNFIGCSRNVTSYTCYDTHIELSIYV
jgi:hypothetical protein